MHVLPTRKLTAAANMAVDHLLLSAYPAPEQPRFRHYEWLSPAFTFGRSQKYVEAEAALPVHATWREAHDHFASRFQLIRRATGGGVVDHRDDWTYALVIPASHALGKVPAAEAYKQVHEILAWALRAQDREASLQPCPCDGEPRNKDVARQCFQRAEPADVIDADGEKLAGAAQRRTRDGLLMQGSLNRVAVRSLHWQRFEDDFAGALAEWLGGAPVKQPFPKWPQEQLASEIAQFESKAWNERR